MVLTAPFFAADTSTKPVQDTQELTSFTLIEYHMGINAKLIVFAPTKRVADTACDAAFKKIAALEDIMSDYRPKSELMRLCSQPKGVPVKVSHDLFNVLQFSQTVSKQSGGGFDITVGPLVQLWRKARKEAKLPEPELVNAAQRLIGFRKLKLNPRNKTATLAENGMRLDLGGIAKGYASDEALKVLRQNGIKSALIEMGGDIVLGDAPPNAEGWQIKVPNDTSGKDSTMFLKNCAISSSGDTEQFVVIDGKRYSHVVDPKTGKGLTRRVQASIIAPNGFTSDPLSTALTLLDEGGRFRLLRHYPSSKAFVRTALDD